MIQSKVSRRNLVLLTAENAKLGPGVPVFNLPAGVTCPGQTKWCAKSCYALKLERIRPSVRLRYQRNLEWIQTNGMKRFVEQISAEIDALNPTILRIHADGDFFSVDYVRAWATIVRRHPNVHFWAYTRSWRVQRLVKALEELRALPNIQMLASWDPTMPNRPPDGWRIAAVPEMPEGTKAMTCLVQIKGKDGEKAKDNCLDCGHCTFAPKSASPNAGNVVFIKH